MSRRANSAGSAGQALVELALVLLLTMLLACGAVAIVQISRSQLALSEVASAAALVGARSSNSTDACQSAHQEVATVVSENHQLLSGPLLDAMGGVCAGPPPNRQSLPTSEGGGSFALWFGYGAADDTFCRVGGAGSPGAPSDGDFLAVLAYRPDLSWIPVVGSWLAPRLTAESAAKIDPFRSRAAGSDQTGDSC